MVESHEDDKTEFAASDLRPGHTYKIRVFAVGSGGKSEVILSALSNPCGILRENDDGCDNRNNI